MCFITNGDLVQNQRTIYTRIKEIEIKQSIIIAKLNEILNLLTKSSN